MPVDDKPLISVRAEGWLISIAVSIVMWTAAWSVYELLTAWVGGR